MHTLAYVRGDAAATGILLSLAGAVPAGSYVALYHLASDLDPAMPVVAERWNALSRPRVTLRSHAQLTAMLDGLLVPVHGAVARKPLRALWHSFDRAAGRDCAAGRSA